MLLKEWVLGNSPIISKFACTSDIDEYRLRSLENLWVNLTHDNHTQTHTHEFINLHITKQLDTCLKTQIIVCVTITIEYFNVWSFKHGYKKSSSFNRGLYHLTELQIDDLNKI